jgi:hypothetical protein
MSVEQWLTGVFWVLVALLSVVSAGVGMAIADKRGRGGAGFLLGLFLGPLGVLLAALLGPEYPEVRSDSAGPGMR